MRPVTSPMSFIMFMAIASNVVASDPAKAISDCKNQPDLAAKCYEMRGRLSLGNGTPAFQIWKVGTNRMLGVVGGDPEPPLMPSGLVFGFNTRVFADYLVCPFTKERPGWMQMVCVESAKNIRIEKYDFETGETRKTFVQGTISFDQN